MKYRCVDIENGTYFFTVNLAERKRTLLIDKIDILRKVFNKVKSDIHLNRMPWWSYLIICMLYGYYR